MTTFLKHMRKMPPSKTLPVDNGVPSPLDIIFACSVCGDTVCDVYAGHTDTVQSLSDGINPKERRVNRLFVSACCHVICIKHIEGGKVLGPLFHPAGQKPRAPCPVCVQEGTEKRPRELFAIRGFKPGDYDPAIPKFWFASPPMKLEGNGPEMEALRFHYLSLVRFGKKTSTALKYNKDDLSRKQKELDTMRSVANSEHAKVLSLEQELKRLRPMEQELHRFKARLPAIHHYLAIVPMLVEQRERMQRELDQLGHRMELENVPPFPYDLPFEQGDTLDKLHADVEQHMPASSHTAGRSAHNTGYADELAGESSPAGRPPKRARIYSPSRTNNPHGPSSRDLMPPPSKTVSRMRSVKKLIPSIRQRFSKSKSLQSSPAMLEPKSDVQMYDNGYCEAVDQPPQPNNDRERPLTRHGASDDPGEPYMSGALPVETLQQAETAAGERYSVPAAGIQSGNFTLRSSSPVKFGQSQAQGLPTETSYLRLMDGLSEDHGLNFGLRDPRLAPHRAYKRTPVAATEDTRHVEVYSHSRDMGASSSQAHRHIGSQNTLPAGTYCAISHDRVREPVTPAPTRFRPTQTSNNVVSPFFGSHDYDSARIPRTLPTEHPNSKPHSNDYQYRLPLEASQDWSTGCSLNGLSFFNSPLNNRNEPIEPGCGHLTSVAPQRYQSRNVDGRGFIVRPGDEPSAQARDGICGPFSRPSMQQTPTYPPEFVSFRPFSRTTRSRAGPAFSRVAPMRSGYYESPVRASRQWSGLERAGVRSSRAPHGNLADNTSATPAKALISRSGRRSVKR